MVVKQLLVEARDEVNRARQLAASTKESRAWLHALPIASLGLRMDNECLRIAVGLHLGIPICGLYPCRHCESEVDVTGRHALSCRTGEGRLHPALNDIYLQNTCYCTCALQAGAS